MRTLKWLLGLALVSLLSSLVSHSALAQSSWSQTDITSMNNAEPNGKHDKQWGYKAGGGKCYFDPSLTTASRTVAAHGCGLIIPKGAVITFAAYKVLTTFTSAADSATIAIHAVAANDIVSAVAISTGTTWDADVAIETIPKVETSSTWLTTTADSEVTFTVGTQALTAGKLVLWVNWLYFGDA